MHTFLMLYLLGAGTGAQEPHIFLHLKLPLFLEQLRLLSFFKRLRLQGAKKLAAPCSSGSPVQEKKWIRIRSKCSGVTTLVAKKHLI